MRRPPISHLPVLGLLLASLLVPPTAARAHTGLVGSDPAPGDTLARPPRQITLTFSEAPLATGTALVAQGPRDRVPLQARVAGNSVVAPWPQDAPAGEYAVTYRVVASDGHPITGSLDFTITRNPTARTASPTPSPTTSAAAAEPAPSDPAEPGTVPLWLWAAGAVLLGAGAYVAVSRGKRIEG